MKQKLMVGVFLIIGFVGGYFLSLSNNTTKIKVASKDFKLAVNGQNDFSCDAIAQAMIFEYPIYQRLETSAGKGSDKIALAIKRKEGHIEFLTRASMETGETTTAKFTITKETDAYITAILPNDVLPGLNILIFDKVNSNAIWQKSTGGNALGLSGQSYFLECR